MDVSIITALIGGAVTLMNVAFTTLFSAYKEKSHKKTEDEKSIEDGLQCLLRAEIIRSHEKYTARKFCPIYAKENLRRAYEAYHNLGGNDIATGLYNDCMELPETADDNERG